MNPVLFYILIGVLALGTILTIVMIGKPRGPVTPGTAVFSLLINGALIVSMFIWGR